MSYKNFEGSFAGNCSALGRVLDGFLDEDKAMARAVRGMEFSIGLESDNKYAVPAGAASGAAFVGDSKHILGSRHNAMVDAMIKKHPEKVEIKPVWDAAKGGWWIDFSIKGVAADAMPNMIAGQLFSPWNVSYFQRIFREPLAFSKFSRMVTKESGTNPWGEVMNLVYEEYAGFAQIAGRLSDQHTNDVNVVNGLMSAKIINMNVTWSITLEEMKRAEQRNNPYGRQAMTQKPKYAKYCLDMLSDYIGWYGNAETDTDGLLNVNPINIWGSDSFKRISESASAVRGSTIYKQLAKIINDFVIRSDCKFHNLRIAMSPECWAVIASTQYSDEYNPKSAMRIFEENYLIPSIDTPNGKIKPSIEWLVDPMLKASSPSNYNMFNEDKQDYFVITSPEIGGGPGAQSQPLVLYGEPLSQFVYPVIPGVYNTQYKTLKRVAGVFAPVPAAIQVYKGLGVNYA